MECARSVGRIDQALRLAAMHGWTLDRAFSRELRRGWPIATEGYFLEHEDGTVLVLYETLGWMRVRQASVTAPGLSVTEWSLRTRGEIVAAITRRARPDREPLGGTVHV